MYAIRDQSLSIYLSNTTPVLTQGKQSKYIANKQKYSFAKKEIDCSYFQILQIKKEKFSFSEHFNISEEKYANYAYQNTGSSK